MTDAGVTESEIFNSKKYKHSRNSYNIQCAFEHFINMLVSDAYLAKVLTEIGISDSVIGVISSIMSLALLFQLASVFAVSKIKNVKKTVIVFNSASQVLFISLYLIPSVRMSVKALTALALLSRLCAYAFMYFVSNIHYKWSNSFVAPDKRASFSAFKEMVSLMLGIIVSLAAGFMFDHFEERGAIRTAFLIAFAVTAAFALCNFICLMNISKPDSPVAAESFSFREIYKNTLGNRNFTSVVIMTSIFSVATSMTNGFLGTFKTNDLLYSVGAVQLMNIAGYLSRFFVSMPLGRYSDKHTFAKGMKLGMVLQLISFVFVIFCTPSTRWCIIAYTLISMISLAGTNQNSFSIIYSYVDSQYFVQAIAIKNCINGAVGFIASLIAGKILDTVQNNGNYIFGFHLYGQQFLAMISVILTGVCIIYISKVIEKQKVLLQ